VALENVFFDLRAGKIHALVRENNVGKSTLHGWKFPDDNF